MNVRRVISCDLAFTVVEPAEVVLQIAPSRSAGRMVEERLSVLTDSDPAQSIEELHAPVGARVHVVTSQPGRLSIAYRAEIDTTGMAGAPATDYERQLYLRPSRYCPSDHLVGFAVAEFGAGPEAGERVAAIAEWIWRRIGYVPGSSSVHDSAEDTLLTAVGTCRDFAHLGVALCRATGIPARFAAVYAPGLFPMDFHAVFEALVDGRWLAYDTTRLAPRMSMVRVGTGRDAADTAFAAITRGIANLELIDVSATVSGWLPLDDHAGVAELP